MARALPGSATAGNLPRYRRFVFGEYEVDLERGALTCRGDEVFLRPKTFAVLIRLLEDAGKLVSREELLASVWPGVVVTDASVTQCLIELRRALGDTDRTLIRTVPRRGVIFDMPVSRRDGEEAPAPTGREPALRRRILGLAGLLALAAAIAWWAIPEGPAPAPGEPAGVPPAPNSIAVLPFVDLSPAGDRGYFADGISEEILNELAQVPGLSVIARTSSFAFKDRNVDVRTIANQLGVATLLEGSVRTEGRAVRITAQLVDAMHGRHLWSQTYDGDVDAVFNVQTRIAKQVASTLQAEAPSIFESIARHEPDPEAYRLVLEGQALYRFRGEGDVREALNLFRRATALDPDYAIAWARLAAACRVLYAEGEMDYEAMIREGLPAATHALQLRPDLAEVQFRAANFASMVGDYELAATYREAALRIDPDHPYLLSNEASRAVFAGDMRRGIELQRRAVQLDPLSPTMRVQLVGVLYLAGRFEAMRSEAAIALRLSPDSRSVVAESLVRAAILERDYRRAQELLKGVPEGIPRDQALALLAVRPGQRAPESAALLRLQSDESVEAAVRLAETHAWLGDPDAAFESLALARERFESARSAIPVYQPIVETRISHFLAPLHDDPRWAAWLAQLPFQDLFSSPESSDVRRLAQGAP